MVRRAWVDEAVTRCKREVTELIDGGVIPPTVATFSELHDYCDANVLGWDDGEAPAMVDQLYPEATGEAWEDALCNLVNEVQDRVDAWLRAGRPEC